MYETLYTLPQPELTNTTIVCIKIRTFGRIQRVYSYVTSYTCIHLWVCTNVYVSSQFYHLYLLNNHQNQDTPLYPYCKISLCYPFKTNPICSSFHPQLLATINLFTIFIIMLSHKCYTHKTCGCILLKQSFLNEKRQSS